MTKFISEISNQKYKKAYLFLENGSVYEGLSFASTDESEGEVVFNTGMVGYPETLSDPSYKKQILVLTYPLIGNYGMPDGINEDLSTNYESTKLQIAGLVVSEISNKYNHWSAINSLSDVMLSENIPGIQGIDTRELTKELRSIGTMQGRIKYNNDSKWEPVPMTHVVSEVSIDKPIEYSAGKKKVGVVDCGCKSNIINSLLKRGVSVVRVPWNFDVTQLDVDGVLFSNGPGDPRVCIETIETAKKALEKNIPTMGICLGHQILSLAVGAKTYKLPFGHRSQNQPCKEINGKRCYITSQNHGFAVDPKTLPKDFDPWFVNLNDNTNEGMINSNKKVMSVQFHPEAKPGPVDTAFLFDEFISWL